MRASGWSGHRAWFRRAFLHAAAVALLLLSCSGRPRFAYDFEGDQELDNLGWKCRTFFRLSDRHVTSGSRSLEVSFHPDRTRARGNCPGLTLDGFNGDWSRSRSLVFDVHNPESATLILGVRIDDRLAPPPADRFDMTVPVRPGDNRIAIPLAGLKTPGTGRPLRLGHITGVILFMDNPEKPHKLFFDRLRLE